MVKSRSEMASDIDEIRARIASAAERSGRSADEITLVAVSKFHSVEEIENALACGIEILGENRVQERAAKAEAWRGPDAVWHMIGHLQKNKARRAVELFSCVQSIDSPELADAVDRAAASAGREAFPVLAEMNASGDESKTGAPRESFMAMIDHIVRECPHLRLDGLMTMGPLGGAESEVRAAFACLRETACRARIETGLPLSVLSMGMSGDYEIAIEEGSTMVRIGTSIFGERSY